MVLGVNDLGEESIYTYNGLGALMENTWVIKKNAYGYHDVRVSAVVDGETVVDFATGKKEKKEKKTAEEVATSPTLNKTSTVVKQFVVDFTSETYKPLMEHEVNGLDYRYVYSDKARLSVVVQGIENGSASVLDSSGELHAYYHCDYLGTTDYLTSAVNSKVISWTSYSEWGEITHNAVLKCGARELDLVKEYATHDFDAVLNMYYAKARFYDADNRRFVAVDPILDPSQYDLREYVTDPMQLVQYLYVKDNAVNWIDPDGEFGLLAGTALATAASALIAGATSAYQSYKTNGKVNWSQAGKAAVGGALTAISVGVAVATGGTAAGLGVMAAGAIVGTRTALHGGTAADVASSMGKAAATALVGGKLLSTASTTTKFVVGTAGTIAGGIKTTKDVKTAVNTVKDKNATIQQKVATVYDACVSAAATVGSAIYAAKNVPESIARPVTSYLEKLQCVKTLGNKATTTEFLQSAANQADQNVHGRGPVAGTKKHTNFKEIVDASGRNNLRTEVSFQNNQEVVFGTKGSVRLDVVEYDSNGLISAIYDLKTGSAGLTPARIAQIRNEVGTLAIPNVPVIEIHPK